MKATLKLGDASKKLKKGAFRFKVDDLSAIELKARNTGKNSHGCLEVVAVRAGSGDAKKDVNKSEDAEADMKAPATPTPKKL